MYVCLLVADGCTKSRECHRLKGEISPLSATQVGFEMGFLPRAWRDAPRDTGLLISGRRLEMEFSSTNSASEMHA
jgi:hypothetical protein